MGYVSGESVAGRACALWWNLSSFAASAGPTMRQAIIVHPATLCDAGDARQCPSWLMAAPGTATLHKPI